jgi:hypothetical protein
MRAIFLLGFAALAFAADPPTEKLSSGSLAASFYLPDPTDGYYRGTRFDWSGVISSLRYQGHEFFGVWFDKYDPKLHDAITGPVEEFLTGDSALGFAEAKPGGRFLRIGVGVLRKDDAPFDRFKTYEILDPGKWRIERTGSTLTFVQTVNDKPTGYGYRYTKVVRLLPGQAVLLIEHTLENTGRKPINTDTYNHNFFVIDGTPTGPDLSVEFAFEPKEKQPLAPLAKLDGKRLLYQRELAKGETTYTELSGFSAEASQYALRLRNAKTHAEVLITGDRPLSKLVYWSMPKTVCPEPYIHMDIAPGARFTWSIRYQFSVAQME